jgi:DNA-binding IclR family transcriptional regulator
VNETVTAAIWGDTGPTIIAMEESGHVVTMNVRIGSVLPLTTTAIGQVFLAYLPDSQTQHLVAAEHASVKSPRRAQDLALQLSAIANAAFRGRRARSSRRRCGCRAGVRRPRQAGRGHVRGGAAPVERCATRDGPVARGLDQAARNLSRQLGFLEATIKAEPVHDQANKRIRPPNAT